MFEQEIEALRQQQLLRTLLPVEGEQDTTILIRGKRLISLASNNYLGLANHPNLKAAALRAIETLGIGAGASRLISGNSVLYDRLEERISLFKKAPACLIFNSGYTANLSVIPALSQKKGLILADEFNHASLFEGCRLSRSMLRIYHHKDMTHLEKLLTKHAAGKTTLIVTDGVFSMEGDLAPLPTICQLAQRYDARIVVDDAHGTGVMGAQGRGTVEHFKVEERVDFQVGTLGKALGTFGAFLVGSQETRTYLLQKAKSLIYTTALPPAILAASLAALDLVERQPGLREQLWKNRDYYVRGLNGLGYEVMQSETPIVPILVGQPYLASTLSQGLFERGIFAPAIRPPTVPKGTSRIRTTVMATHTREQLDDVLEALADIGKGLGLRG